MRNGSIRVLRTVMCVAVFVPVFLLIVAPAGAATITSWAGSKATAPTYVTANGECPGTYVTITGSGFVSDGTVSGVTVGGAPAATFWVGSDTTVFALVGAGAQNNLPITVTTPKGTATSSTAITLLPCAVTGTASSKPVVSTVAPKKAKGGKKLELIGSGFVGTTGVTVGGLAANYAIPSDGIMYVIVPAAAKSGSLAISITTSAGVAKATVTKTA